MGIFQSQNPGIGGIDELTDVEELFLQNLAGLTYSEGDILYVDSNGDLINLGVGTNGQVLTVSSGVPSWATPAGSGDVSGPVSSTDNAIARWDGTGGDTLQDSALAIDDSGNLTGAASITVGSTAGITIGPGTDTNIDLITIDDATHSPKLLWQNTQRAIVSYGGSFYVDEDKVAASGTSMLGMNVDMEITTSGAVSGTQIIAGARADLSFDASHAYTDTTGNNGVSGGYWGLDVNTSSTLDVGQGALNLATITQGTNARISGSNNVVVGTGSGTTTNVIAGRFEVLNPAANTFTNVYGIKVEDITVGGTLNYAIYTGAGNVRFGDNVNIAASKQLQFNGTAILADSSGTMTLSNVDALDSTTKTTVNNNLKRIVTLIILDDTTDTSVGDGAGDITFTIPAELNGWNLTDADASVETAGTTGTTDIQINNVTQAADMLTTKITIDSGETSSYTAATAPVIDTANDDVATGDKIRIDIDAVSTTAAKGLQVILTFEKP